MTARFGPTMTFSRTIVLPRQSAAEAARPQRRTLREIALVVASASATAVSTQTTTAQSRARDGAPRDGQSFRELVYREKHAWVQVLADDNDTVARFSVTVTDPRFRFSVRDLTWGHLAVRLGYSRFSDVREGLSTSGRSLLIGAHNHEYAEACWFGNRATISTTLSAATRSAPGSSGSRSCGKARPGTVQEHWRSMTLGPPPSHRSALMNLTGPGSEREPRSIR
jgi:hypothetical protein